MRPHDLGQPYQGCQCEAHKRLRANLRKRKAIGKPVMLKAPAIGATRRLRALMAMGYSARSVSLQTGISQQELGYLLAGKRKRLSASRCSAIADLYERLAMHPAPSSREASRARNRAAQAGWMPPLAWDDIDSPRERPRGRRAA